MSPQPAKSLPVPDMDTQPFWDACKARELRVQRCAGCGRFRWPPRAFCPRCFSWDAEWARLSGRGTVYSYTVVHHVTSPAFKEDVPYVVALVTLEGTDGAVQLIGNVIGCPWEHVQAGMPVEVMFEDVSPDVTLPQFRPSGAEQ
ncbi:MAG TPA: Zn-ribbon domain-containing OB-fold protein [Chloroflexota bacterium]